MAERKVQNKYVSPYFNHEKLVKPRRQKEKQDNVRMMLPFSIKCDACGNYLHAATKLNMRKEICVESYLGIELHRFYMKCITCYREITMRTDPKNHDYALEKGATRLYESWKDGRAAEELLRELRQDAERGDPMKSVENRTYDARRDLDIKEALDEIRTAARRHARYDLDTVMEVLDRRDCLVAPEELEDFRARLKRSEAAKKVKEDDLSLRISPLPAPAALAAEQPPSRPSSPRPVNANPTSYSDSE